MAHEEKWGSLLIEEKHYPWTDKVIAAIFVGPNRYTEEGNTFAEAAANLRIMLAGLFAYSDACKVMSFAEAEKVKQAAIEEARRKEAAK